MVLLAEHSALIMQCDSFEDINEFFKTTLPGSISFGLLSRMLSPLQIIVAPMNTILLLIAMSIIQMERVINIVFETDIAKELAAYEIEYHVLRDELVTPSTDDGLSIVGGEQTAAIADVRESNDDDDGEKEERLLRLVNENAHLKRQVRLMPG